MVVLPHNTKANKNEQKRIRREAFELQWDNVKLPHLVFAIETNFTSFAEFCRTAKIGKSTLHDILYGKVKPTRRTIIKISSSLGKDSSVLFKNVS